MKRSNKSLAKPPLVSVLREQLKGKNTRQIVAYLVENNMVNFTALERYEMRMQVIAMCEKGMTKMAAISRVAEKFCCSNEKVCSAVYRK